MYKLFYSITIDKYSYVIIQFYQLVRSFRCNIVIYDMLSSVCAHIPMFLQVGKLSISNEVHFFLNFTFLYFSRYEQILCGKKYLANSRAPARFYSISITVESALTSLTPSLVGQWMIGWLLILCFSPFSTIVKDDFDAKLTLNHVRLMSNHDILPSNLAKNAKNSKAEKKPDI